MSKSGSPTMFGVDVLYPKVNTEAILVAEKCSGPKRSFLLMAWDWSKAQSSADIPPSAEPRVWQDLWSFADEVVQERFNGAPLVRLDPREVNARLCVDK
jgi:hypothetical protein